MEILTAGTVRRASVRHRAKLLPDRSLHCRDMAIVRFFKMAAVRYLGFLKVADISQFLDFQDYGRRHL